MGTVKVPNEGFMGFAFNCRWLIFISPENTSSQIQDMLGQSSIKHTDGKTSTLQKCPRPDIV